MTVQVGQMLVCAEVDTLTNTCTVEVWMPVPTLLPPMTAIEGNLVGAAFALVWGLCWTFVKARRVVQ